MKFGNYEIDSFFISLQNFRKKHACSPDGFHNKPFLIDSFILNLKVMETFKPFGWDTMTLPILLPNEVERQIIHSGTPYKKFDKSVKPTKKTNLVGY